MRAPTSIAPHRKRQNERGSVLVICMVLAGLGTIGVAAWIALLDARGNQVEAQIANLQQRAADRNSHALAHRAIYSNHLPSATALASDVTYQLPGDLGSCIVRGYTSVPLQNSSSIRVSRNGGTPVRSFTTDVTVTLPNGTGTSDWQYQLRSYNPILGGDLLTVHPPFQFDSNEKLVEGELIVEGRALFWDAVKDDFPGDFQADQLVLPNDILGTTKFENSSGNETLPLNYPIPKQTTGLAGSSTPYDGKMEVFAATPNGHNSYQQRVIASGDSEILNGQTAVALGSGPDTRPAKFTDAVAEALIATRDPKDLKKDLVRYYPLSSPVLQKVFDKSDKPFNDKELYTVLSGQGVLANDSLTELLSNQESRLKEDDLRLLLETSNTVYSSSGSGKVRVFLNRSNLPHLTIENVGELEIYGQETDAQDTQAADYPARILLVINDATTTLDNLRLYEKSARRFALAISSDQAAPATTRIDFDGTNNFPNWHGVFEFKNTTAEFDTSEVSEAVIFGGIRTNQPIDVRSGTLRIKQQFDPRGLENLLSRNAWIEAYQL